MKININELNIKKEINIDCELDFSKENFSSLGIKEVKKASFKGKLYYNSLDEVVIEGDLLASLILLDANDLSDYLYEIDVKVEEILNFFENILDINAIMWENTVLEVPMCVSKNSLEDISGNGWKVKKDFDDEEESDLKKFFNTYKGGE